MSTTVVGDIVYNLDVRTTAFMSGMDNAEGKLEQFGGTTDKTEKQVNSFGGELNNVTKALKAFAAAAALREIASMVQGYQEMADRVRLATSSTEEFNMVQARLLETANGTYRSLGEAQELYIRTADSLRSMGYTTEQAIDVTDAMSYAFVTNAANAEKASAATDAFSKILAKGKVEADAWETILAAVPSVINAIADSTGKTTAEIRNLGASGKLLASDLTEGLRNSLGEVSEQAAGMSNNLTDAGVRVRTALTAMFVSVENQTGAWQSLTNGIIAASNVVLNFSNDADGMAAALNLATTAGAAMASVYAGRLLTALYTTTAAKVALVRSSIAAQAAAKVQAANALALATAEFAASRAEQARATALLASLSLLTDGAAKRAAAVEALAIADARAAAAEKGLQAAMATSAEVAKTSTVAMRGLQAVMGFLGGPVGVILLAATALYSFATSAREAKNPTDLLTQSVENLGKAQLDLQKIKLTEAIAEQEKLAKGSWLTQNQIKNLNDRLEKSTPGSEGYEKTRKQLVELQAEGEGAAQMSAKLQDQLKKVNEAIDARSKPAAVSVSPIAPKTSPEDAKALENQRKRLELAKLTGEAQARAAALQQLSADATEAEKKQISDMAAEVYKLEQAKKSEKKTTADAAADKKKAAAEQKRIDKEALKNAEENKKAITDYAIEIAQLANKTQDYSEAAALAKLNKFATPEDVRVMRELAAVQQQIIQAEKNKELVKQVDPIANENFRYEDEIAQLKKANDAKLIENERYLELKNAAETTHNQNMQALEVERFRSQSVNNEALMSSVEALGQASTNVLSGLASGTMSVKEATGQLANTVLNSLVGSYVQAGVDFVKQEIAKRAAVQATQATQTSGIAQLVGMQAGATAAIASTTTGTAATTGTAVATSMAPAAGLSSIASFGAAALIGGAALVGTMLLAKSFGGGRQYGGNVNADSFYRINETGPEIFTDNTGKQYMTGANGRVTSNRDAFGGSSGRPLQVIIENHTGQQVTATQEQLTDKDVLRIVAGDMQNGGITGRAVNNITGTNRKGQ